jgi:hypothetical protein
VDTGIFRNQLITLAGEVHEHNVSTVARAPGFMRTERVMSHAGGEMDWKKIPWLKKSESPEYIGRAVAALAGDPHVMRKPERRSMWAN